MGTMLSEKKLLLKEAQISDVILSFNRDKKISSIIANVTNSEWSHVMMYIGNGNVVESSVGGIHVTPLSHYFSNNYNLCLLHCTNLTKVQQKDISKYTLNIVGKRYGYLQMFWYLFLRSVGKSENPKWQLDIQPNAMVCSEAIAEAYRKCGKPIKPKIKDAGAEPSDFWQSKIFEKKMMVV